MTTGAAVFRLAVEWSTCLPFAHPSIGVASAARSAVTKTNELGPPIIMSPIQALGRRMPRPCAAHSNRCFMPAHY